MKNPNVLVREVSAEQLPLLLAQDIAQRLQHAISQKGSAVLSVSGGSSPIALFHALRVTAIDWAKVTITLVDERYVPTSDPQSNAYLVRSHLSQQNAERARFIPLIDNAHAPLPPLQEMVAKANYRMLGIAVADVLVLGMGADGHTASLFSHAPNFDDALDLRQSNAYIGIELPADTFNAGASVSTTRISQTLRQVLSAQHLALPITGSEKRVVLEQAMRGKSKQLPVSFVLNDEQALANARVQVWLGL